MGTQAAVRELLGERARIDRALAALGANPPGTSTTRPAAGGQKKPPQSVRAATSTQTKTATPAKRTFKMSDEAKEKIRKAQKARWDKIKKSMTPVATKKVA